MITRSLLYVMVLALLVSNIGLITASARPAASTEQVPVRVLPDTTSSSKAVTPQSNTSALPAIALRVIGSYKATYDGGAAEIVAYDPASKRLFVTNSDPKTIDILDISNPEEPTLVTAVELKNLPAPYYSEGSPNSVAVSNGVVALAVEHDDTQQPGYVIFFDTSGTPQAQVEVGTLPDMLTFTPDGTKVLVANEGEPNDEYTNDPEGSISIIDISGGVAGLTQANVTTLGFGAFNAGAPLNNKLDPAVRIYGNDGAATVAQDLEPEYIAATDDAAWVTLQENNAVAIVQLTAPMTITHIASLGFKDHSQAGNGMDASDKDDTINIQPWPVKGMYQPDSIGVYTTGDGAFLVTANEGDAREYEYESNGEEQTSYSEETRIEDLVEDQKIDETAFSADELAAFQDEERLGRLKVTTATGDTNNDGKYEALYSYGARSFSIWQTDTTSVTQVYDSGDDFEQITAARYPTYFNDSGEPGEFDDRSDDKGPEPEGLTLGVVDDKTYAFIGLERIGGIMVYDVTDPSTPTFVQYINNRDMGGDMAPEGLTFIAAADSPIDSALLVVANEDSGTTTIYEIYSPGASAATLTLLHHNDGESKLLTSEREGVEIGGVATFKSVVDREIADARARGNSVVTVYAGDAFLASTEIKCSHPTTGTMEDPVYDAIAQRQIDYTAHILGNHEFDYTPDFLERFIRSFKVNGVLAQPFLSANLDFSSEAGFADLIDADGLFLGDSLDSIDGKVVAKSFRYDDPLTGQSFGIVGTTTPELETISSPRDVVVKNTMADTATAVQTEIDRLQNDGINKIILVSHLQSVENDRELIKLLRGVDVAVAGGGDELLLSSSVPTTTQLLPGTASDEVDGTYPLTEQDKDGKTVHIVTSEGDYKYLGRLDVSFDAAGTVTGFAGEQSYPRRVVVASEAATQMGLTDAISPDADLEQSVVQPVKDCVESLETTEVANSQVELDGLKSSVRTKETNLGNLVTDAFLFTYDRLAQEQSSLTPRSSDNPIIAVQNGGGIRINEVMQPGSITRANIIDVLPFNNEMTLIEGITPADVKTIFEHSVSNIEETDGRFLQVSGVTVAYSITAEVGSRVLSVTLELEGSSVPLVENGQPVDGAPTIGIVTNSFTAAGGDDYTIFERKTTTRLTESNGAPIYYEQPLYEYVDHLGTVTSAQYPAGGMGRLILNENTTPSTADEFIFLPLVKR